MDLYTDFTTLKWVKWTDRKPTANGRYLIRFNGKNMGRGTFIHGDLRRLEGLDNSEFKNYMDTFYWMEEIMDIEGFRKATE